MGGTSNLAYTEPIDRTTIPETLERGFSFYVMLRTIITVEHFTNKIT